MLNFHIRNIILKNGDTRYRAVITNSGKAIKTKTFRRKTDARTWGTRAVIEHQEYEAKGIRPSIIPFDRLADEYMSWWSGKDHDRARLVKWWVDQFGKTLLPEITPDEIRAKLKSKRSLAPATYNRYLAVLSSIMDFATRQQEDDSVSEQYIEENPCKKVRSLQLDNKVVRNFSLLTGNRVEIRLKYLYDFTKTGIA